MAQLGGRCGFKPAGNGGRLASQLDGELDDATPAPPNWGLLGARTRGALRAAYDAFWGSQRSVLTI